MKRILVLLAIAAVGMAASVSAAQAEVITNVHNVVTSTVNDNHTSDRFQFQPHGTMVGAITGDVYRVTGVTQGTSTESLQDEHHTLTYVNNFRLIGPGPGNNLLVHETAHVTIDGDDIVVVEHDKMSIECK